MRAYAPSTWTSPDALRDGLNEKAVRPMLHRCEIGTTALAIPTLRYVTEPALLTNRLEGGRIVHPAMSGATRGLDQPAPSTRSSFQAGANSPHELIGGIASVGSHVPLRASSKIRHRDSKDASVAENSPTLLHESHGVVPRKMLDHVTRVDDLHTLSREWQAFANVVSAHIGRPHHIRLWSSQHASIPEECPEKRDLPKQEAWGPIHVEPSGRRRRPRPQVNSQSGHQPLRLRFSVHAASMTPSMDAPLTISRHPIPN